jgi:hypothetical protein
MTHKDPETAKLAAQVVQLDKTVRAMINRILALEKEAKILRGRIGRASDHLGTVDRSVSRLSKLPRS